MKQRLTGANPKGDDTASRRFREQDPIIREGFVEMLESKNAEINNLRLEVYDARQETAKWRMRYWDLMKASKPSGTIATAHKHWEDFLEQELKDLAEQQLRLGLLRDSQDEL